MNGWLADWLAGLGYENGMNIARSRRVQLILSIDNFISKKKRCIPKGNMNT
jgi:hypothetical protein